MMKMLLLAGLIFTMGKACAQELFVYTEPASNMAAKSIGVRLTNNFADGKGRLSYRLMPELMWGISKKMLLHINGIFDNEPGDYRSAGAGLYFKYRFLSRDEVHEHFRMSAYGRYTLATGRVRDHYISTVNGSAYEGGLIATALKNRQAFSASAAVLHAMDNINGKFVFADRYRNAVNYSLSSGRLLLPKNYKSYRQTNMNIMLELLGQANLGNGESSLDVAPSLQFIFNSKARLDIGYRQPLVKAAGRQVEPGGLIRLEYNFYNVY